PDQKQVADFDLIHGDFHPLIPFPYFGGFRLQFQQLAYGVGSPSFADRFQPAPHQDQRDDHGAAFKVDMFVQRKGIYSQAEAVGGRRPQSDQDVHIGAASPEGAIGADIKWPAQPDLHDTSQQALQPEGELSMVAGMRPEHLTK